MTEDERPNAPQDEGAAPEEAEGTPSAEPGESPDAEGGTEEQQPADPAAEGESEEPASGDEEPGQSWVDVSGDGRGLTVINDAKHGYDVRGGDIGISAVRSPVCASTRSNSSASCASASAPRSPLKPSPAT